MAEYTRAKNPNRGAMAVWLPALGATLGGMDRLDNYVTGLTDNGNGSYTFGLDATKARTDAVNGDILWFDASTGWNDPRTQVLDLRIVVTSAPANRVGTPWAGIMLKKGVRDRTFSGFLTAFIQWATGPIDRYEAENQSADAGDVMIAADEIDIASLSGTVVVDDGGGSMTTLTARAFNGSSNGIGLDHTAGLSTGIGPSNVAAGDNTASGYSTGLVMSRAIADAGVDSVTLTIQYRARSVV